MKQPASNPEQYLKSLSEDRRQALSQLRNCILENLDANFHETMQYGMISYVVPHKIYPKGYHCKSTDPLPFISIASQKNFIALYHMGLYADDKLLQWFQKNYSIHCKRKLDMGKSCIRFKYLDDIPYALIADLLKKMSVQSWIDLYESKFLRQKKL